MFQWWRRLWLRIPPDREASPPTPPPSTPSALAQLTEAYVGLIKANMEIELQRLQATADERKEQREWEKKLHDERREAGRRAYASQRKRREEGGGQRGLFCRVKSDPTDITLKAEEILAHNEGRCRCNGAQNGRATAHPEN